MISRLLCVRRELTACYSLPDEFSFTCLNNSEKITVIFLPTKFFPKVPFWKSLLSSVTSHPLTRVTVVEVAAKSLFTALSLVVVALRRLDFPCVDALPAHA